MQLSKQSIVLVSLLVEGFLAVLFVIWAYLTNYTFDPIPEYSDLVLGVAMTIPLLIFNFFIFSFLAPRFSFGKPFIELKETIVKPLADELNYKTALLVAVFAGIGEELFFRGLVQIELGFIVANLIFALIHFGSSIKKYLLVAIIYFFIGLYFSFLCSNYFSDLTGYSPSLWVPIITHCLYDYLVLMYMKYYSKKLS